MPLCTILQLRPGDENHKRCWTPLGQWGEDYPKMSLYEQVYTLKTQPVSPKMLEELYERFNIEHPCDYTGHSLSISDVLLFDDKAAYFVDGEGFSYLDADRFFDLPAYHMQSLFSGYIRKMGVLSDKNEVIGTWQIPPTERLLRLMCKAASSRNIKLVELPGVYPIDFKLEDMNPDDIKAFIHESAKAPYDMETALAEDYLRKILKAAKDDHEKNTHTYGPYGILTQEAECRYNAIHYICVYLNIDI